MPKNKDFARRLEILDECLRNHLKKWSLEALLEQVNIKLNDRYGKKTSKRTLQADLKYLQDERDAPIAKRRDGQQTYFYYSNRQFSIRNLPINDEELGFLKDALNILRQVNDFSIIGEIQAVITKIENTISTHTDGNTAIIQFENHTIASGVNYIDDLYQAIKAGIAIKLSYQPFNKESVIRICHPYLLKEYRNRWFLIGQTDNRNELTVFALDRIRSLKATNIPYKANNSFKPETYFNNMIGVTMPESATPEIIEIKVSPASSPYILTKPIHNCQEILNEYENGGILIRLKLIINFELVSVLLSYGNGIEILKPRLLRDLLQEKLNQAADLYKDS